MTKIAIGALTSLFAFAVLGCQPATHEDIEAIQAKQDEILQKLAELEGRAIRPAQQGPPPEDYDRVHTIEVGGAPILGNPNAPVTLVEFSDFQCPYCARTSPDVKALYEKYPDQLRVVYKHFPLSFHRAARPTAIASLAAQDQGKFWEFHDVLFDQTNKRTLSGSDEDLLSYAQEAGLDLERFQLDLEQKRDVYEQRIDADYAQGQDVDVRGTPTLYINGKKVRNRSVEAMSATVDAILTGGGKTS